MGKFLSPHFMGQVSKLQPLLLYNKGYQTICFRAQALPLWGLGLDLPPLIS